MARVVLAPLPPTSSVRAGPHARPVFPRPTPSLPQLLPGRRVPLRRPVRASHRGLDRGASQATAAWDVSAVLGIVADAADESLPTAS